MGLFDGTSLERPVVCERCGQVMAECQCPPEAKSRTSAAEQTAKLAIEKRRKGKVVTVIRGLSDEGEHLAELLSRLKSSCGAGGSVQEGAIEIQGRQLDRVRSVLNEAGYQVKG